MTNDHPLPPSASTRLTQQQIETALIWSQDMDLEDAPDAMAAFVDRFEATWGPATPATLLRTLYQSAPPASIAVLDSAHAPAGDATTRVTPGIIPKQVEVRKAAMSAGEDQWSSGERRDGEESLAYKEAPLEFNVLFAFTALGIALTDWPSEAVPNVAPEDHLRQHGWSALRFFTEQPRDELTLVACDVMASYLHSPHPRERWTSALYLGRLRDERAVPVLVRMLTEFLSLDRVHAADGYPVFFYEEWRSAVAPLLWQTGDTRLAATFRQALLAALEVERAIPRPSGPELEYVPYQYRFTGQDALQMYASDCQPWTTYQHQLVYGLGRLGAFGALVGVETPVGVYNFGATWSELAVNLENRVIANAEAENHADRFRGYLWRIQACCGYLESEFSQPNNKINRRSQRIGVYSFREIPDFARAVERLLEEQFGLEPEERQLAMRDYEEAGYLMETTRYYGLVMGQAAAARPPPRAT